MAINFPNSPSNGDTHTAGGKTFTYDATAGLWNPSDLPKVLSSDAPPSNPATGDLWFDSSTGTLYFYYNDGSSSQWVGVSGADGVDGVDGVDGASATPTSYTNLAAFPSSGNTLGDFAVAQDTKALYMWNETQWEIASSGSDGAGLGLDADTVDGIQGSNLLRSDTSGTISGNLNVTGTILPSDISAAYAVNTRSAITVATTTQTVIASLSITPHRANSRILVIATGDGNPNQSGGWHRYAIFRNGTRVGGRYINENAGGISKNCPFSVVWIDHPNTTSAVTYDVRAWQGSGSFTFGEDGDIQGTQIVAMEIL